MKSLTEAWLTAAKNDMDVIGRIIADDHLTHIVAFHAQQAVEKCFKALMEEHAVDARKIHSLVTLYAKVEIFLGQKRVASPLSMGRLILRLWSGDDG